MESLHRAPLCTWTRHKRAQVPGKQHGPSPCPGPGCTVPYACAGALRHAGALATDVRDKVPGGTRHGERLAAQEGEARRLGAGGALSGRAGGPRVAVAGCRPEARVGSRDMLPTRRHAIQLPIGASIPTGGTRRPVADGTALGKGLRAYDALVTLSTPMCGLHGPCVGVRTLESGWIHKARYSSKSVGGV